MSGQGLSSTSRVLRTSTVRATTAVARRLRVEPGTSIFEMRRVRMVDDVAVSFDVSWFPLGLGKKLAREDLARRDVFWLIENACGTALGAADCEIGAVAAEARARRASHGERTPMTTETLRWGETLTLEADVLVIGGGSAGSVAAIKAKEAMPGATVLVLEKANVRRSGAISMGMDGLNNAIILGHATPEQYVKEITTRPRRAAVP